MTNLAIAQDAETLLNPMHLQHLRDEGFTADEIQTLEENGVRSITQREAMMKNYKVWNKDEAKWESSSGLYFPFTTTSGQVRLDTPLMVGGKPAKYLTPCKGGSHAYIPEGCEVITEGAKDGWRGTLTGGIPTGFVAGVSHIRAALPENCGYTILFDSDGWHNPAICQALIRGAIHCKGKIQLIPPILGDPKGGMCEYFNAGHDAGNYRALIDSAMWPHEFLMEWAKRWPEMPADKRATAARLAAELAQELIRA